MVPTVRFDVGDRHLERAPARRRSRAGPHWLDERCGPGPRSSPWSWLDDWCRWCRPAGPGRCRMGGQVEARGLPVVDGVGHVEPARRGRPLRPGCAKPSSASSSRTSSAMNSKKLTTNSGLPLKRLRSSGFWVATPTGQVSRWQTRIMTQPDHHQRGGGEAELLGAEQGGDDHVAAGLELAVDLHHDPVAQAVEQQGLLGLGQAQLPGGAGVLERGQRGGAGAAVVARDEHHVGVGLGHAGGHGAHAHLGHQLDVDPGGRSLAFFRSWMSWARSSMRVDVVVGRRADEAHARASSAGSWRSTGRPCGRAAGRPRRAWRPGPS